MDKKALPEYDDLDYGHIQFEWKISSFLPLSSAESVFKEEINCNAFKLSNDIERYWSFPELLLDARWLQESVLDKRNHAVLSAGQDTLTNDTDLQFPYLKSEFQLYRIVTTISAWAWNVERYFKKMLEEESKEHLFPLEDGLIKIATEYATLSTAPPITIMMMTKSDSFCHSQSRFQNPSCLMTVHPDSKKTQEKYCILQNKHLAKI